MKKIKTIDIILIVAGLMLVFFMLFMILFNPDLIVNFKFLYYVFYYCWHFLLILFLIKLILFFNKKDWVEIILNSISIIIIFVYFFYFLFCYSFIDSEEKNYKYEPTIDEYSKIVKKYKKRFKYFPKEIPANAENYYFYMANDCEKTHVDFLEFNIDEEYIEKIIEENKNNIYETFQYEYINKLPYTNLYILKNKKFNKKDMVYIFKPYEAFSHDYNEGMIISNNKDKIFFFYFLKNKLKKTEE